VHRRVADEADATEGDHQEDKSHEPLHVKLFGTLRGRLSAFRTSGADAPSHGRLADVRVTAKVDYALRALVELAAAGGTVKGDALAQAQAIPLKFLENILAELRRGGLVGSQRGADGGYRLQKPAAEISVADIIRAVEGPLADVHGTPPEQLELLGVARPVKEVWLATRAALRSVLEVVTVADIAANDLPPVVGGLLSDPEAWIRR
jgi:Rrf2 family protein